MEQRHEQQAGDAVRLEYAALHLPPFHAAELPHGLSPEQPGKQHGPGAQQGEWECAPRQEMCLGAYKWSPASLLPAVPSVSRT